MAEKRGGLYAPRGLRTIVDVQQSGGTYLELPGVQNVAHSSGSRESSTITAFEGVMSVLGSQSIEPVTFTVAAYQPYMEVWQQIDKAFDDNAPVTFRISTPTAKLAEDVTLGVKKTGTASKIGGLDFSSATALKKEFAGDKYQRGHVVKIDGVIYVIRSIDIDDSGNVTDFAPNSGTLGVRVNKSDVSDISADVTPATASIDEPGVRIEFTSRIESKPGFNVGASATEPLSATLTVRPLNPLPIAGLYAA